MLGDRYGWCQTANEPNKLLDKSFSYAVKNFKSLEWIDQYRNDTSVTKVGGQIGLTFA